MRRCTLTLAILLGAALAGFAQDSRIPATGGTWQGATAPGIVGNRKAENKGLFGNNLRPFWRNSNSATSKTGFRPWWQKSSSTTASTQKPFLQRIFNR